MWTDDDLREVQRQILAAIRRVPAPRMCACVATANNILGLVVRDIASAIDIFERCMYQRASCTCPSIVA